MKKKIESEQNRFLLPESRKEFISRMIWLIGEIKTSDKGTDFDIMKLLEFHLRLRDKSLNALFLGRLQKHIYENVDGNRQKLFTNWLDLYENQKE